MNAETTPGGERLALGFDVGDWIEADRSLGVRNVEIADLVGAPVRDAVGDHFSKIAVGIDNGDPLDISVRCQSEDFHDFFSGLEKANEIGPCENVQEFSHGLRPFLPFRKPYFLDVSASRQNFRDLDH